MLKLEQFVSRGMGMFYWNRERRRRIQRNSVGALIAAVGDARLVKSLAPKTTVEIRDLNCVTNEMDVEEALKRGIQDIGDIKLRLTKTNARGQRMAIVQMGDTAVEKLLRQGKIKIGWVYCRVRSRATVLRCYQCLSCSHLSRNCQGPDRNNLCYKCGKRGHKAMNFAETRNLL